jgi:hypothetical protein
VGQLGGREPLPTAEGRLGGSLPQDTPEPSRHPLVGTWLLAFTEPDHAPAQVIFGDDGLVTVIDAVGNRGAGVWMPRGQQSGIMVVVVRGDDASGQPGQITIVQGTIAVDAAGDAATLAYTIEPADGADAAPKRTGPFTAKGQRLPG